VSENRRRLLAGILDLVDRYAREVAREKLDTDLETWLKVRGALELAAQCCIDLAVAMVTERGLGVPQTYREVFLVLARAGVLPPALAVQLGDWAGLRNVLVRVYTSLDLDTVYAALSQTAPLREFLRIAERELPPDA